MRSSILLKSLLVAGLLFPMLAPPPAHAQEELENVDALVDVSFSGLRFNRRTGTFDTVATLQNVSGIGVVAPIQLKISDLDPLDVALANASGVDAGSGAPYVSVAAAGLPAGATANVVLQFANPQRRRFTFSHEVLGVPERALSLAPISWSQDSLRLTVGAGANTTQVEALQFTSQESVAGVSIEVVGAIADFLIIDSHSITSLAAGETYELGVRLVVPPQVAEGFYTGRIRITTGGSSVDLTLPVAVRLDFGESVVAPDAVTFSKSTLERFDRIEGDGSTLVFSSLTDEVAALTVGSILILPPLENLPNGFIGEVQGVRLQGGSAFVDLGPASLADAIESADISISGGLELESAGDSSAIGTAQESRIGGDKLAVAPKAATIGALQLSLTVVVVDGDDNLETKNDQIRVIGSTEIDPSFSLDARFRSRRLEYLEFKNTVKKTTNLTVEAELEISRERKKQIEVPIKTKPIVIWAGWVPVVFKPEFELFVGVDGSLSVAATMGVTETVELEAGVRFEDEAWSPVASSTVDYEFDPPMPSASMSVRGYAEPKLTLKLYGVAGPFAKIQAQAKLEADTAEDPWWSLCAGLQGLAGAEIEVFDRLLANVEFVLFDFCPVLLQAGGPFPGSTNEAPTAALTASANGGQVFEGEVLSVQVASGSTASVLFSANRSSDSDGAVESWTWTLDGSAVSTSESFTFDLGVGTYDIGLVVGDDRGELSTPVSATIVVEALAGGGGGGGSTGDLFSDSFNRPDGAPGNGWTAWGAGAEIVNGELRTIGQPNVGGGASRTLPVTLPVVVEFDFRTLTTEDEFEPNLPVNGGGWSLEINATSPGHRPSADAALKLWHYSGAGRMIRITGSGVEDLPALPNPIPGWSDYSDEYSHIRVTVEQDLSTFVEMTYPDGTSATMSFGPASPGTVGGLLNIGNSSRNQGPHFIDNLRVFPKPGGGGGAPTAGLIAHWDFESGGGSTLVDRTGNGHDGDLFGGPAWVSSTVAGGSSALQFSNGRAVKVPNHPDLLPGDHSYTFSAWFKTPGSIDPQTITWSQRGCCGNTSVMSIIESDAIISPEIAVPNGITYTYHDDRVVCCINPEQARVSTDFAVTDDQWHQVVAVRDRAASQAMLYIDGVLVDARPDSEAIVDTTSTFGIGHRPSDAIGRDERFFQGLLDEIRIYDRAVTPSEVLDLYNSGQP